MGHIGYRLAEKLSLRHQIFGVYNKNKNVQKIKKLKSCKVTLIKNNLENKDQIKKILKKYKIQECIFAAGVSHNTLAKKDVNKTIKINCLSLNFFLEAQMNGLFKKLIYISTGSVFQNIKSSKLKIFETNWASPNSIYSLSKRLGEKLLETFFIKSKKRVCALRVSWVYGPPLITKKIIPQRGPIPFIIYKLFIQNKKIIKFKSGGSFAASYTYIDDICETLEKMIKLKIFPKPVLHFGSGKNYNNFYLSKVFNNIFKNKKVIFKKGIYPWSNDSTIRGPLKTNYNYPFLKSRISLEQGIINFVNSLKKKKRHNVKLGYNRVR